MEQHGQTRSSKKSWSKPELRCLGTVADIDETLRNLDPEDLSDKAQGLRKIAKIIKAQIRQSMNLKVRV